MDGWRIVVVVLGLPTSARFVSKTKKKDATTAMELSTCFREVSNDTLLLKRCTASHNGSWLLWFYCTVNPVVQIAGQSKRGFMGAAVDGSGGGNGDGVAEVVIVVEVVVVVQRAAKVLVCWITVPFREPPRRRSYRWSSSHRPLTRHPRPHRTPPWSHTFARILGGAGRGGGVVVVAAKGIGERKNHHEQGPPSPPCLDQVPFTLAS